MRIWPGKLKLQSQDLAGEAPNLGDVQNSSGWYKDTQSIPLILCDFYVISMGLYQTFKPLNAWLWFSLWELPFRGIPQFETTFRWQFLTWRLFNFLMMSFFTTCCGSLALAQECALQKIRWRSPKSGPVTQRIICHGLHRLVLSAKFWQSRWSTSPQQFAWDFWYLWTWLNPSWKTFPIQTHSISFQTKALRSALRTD